MEGRGVVFVFALPIAATSCVAGILISPALHLSLLTALCATAISLVWLNVRLTVLGIALAGFLFGIVRMELNDEATERDSNSLIIVRQYFDARLSRHLHDPERALVSGILFGGSSQFSREWRQVFRATGTSHIVAVSGANLVFVVQWLEIAMRIARLRRRSRLILNALLITLYVLITGAAASVVRAAIMTTLAQLAPIIGRPAHPLHMLSAAAFAMVLVSPHVATDIGFQFSCLATLGLIIATPRSNEGVTSHVGATVAATLFVLPLQLFYFHTLSFSAVIANLCILPFIPFIMIVGTVQLIVGTAITALPAQWAATGMLTILKWFATVPGSSGEITLSGVGAGAIYAVVGFFVCYQCYVWCRQ